MSKPLTVELIHMKTKSNQVDRIKNLNLWGNNLDDIRIVQNMQDIEVLSLAVNHISSLKDVQNCYKLKELYMRRNNIRDIQEIRYLQNLRQLQKLSLMENPMADHPMYRLYAIKCCQNLEKLDDKPITFEEREKAESVDFSELENFQESPPRSRERYQSEDYQAYEEPERRGGGPPQYYEEPRPQSHHGSPQERQRGFNPVKHSPQKDQNNYSPPYMQQQPLMNPNSTNFMAEEPVQYPPPKYGAYEAPHGLHRANTVPVESESPPHHRQMPPSKPKAKKSTRDQYRNENILCAIIALMKELDKGGLEFVKRDAEKRLSKIDEDSP